MEIFFINKGDLVGITGESGSKSIVVDTRLL